MRSLELVLASPNFQASVQLPAFLSYVVKEELAGRGDKIKAYTVAVDALGRPDSFDPSADPVIRVIANRLRKALDGFYGETDQAIPVRIELVRGSYRPVFHRLEDWPAPSGVGAETPPVSADMPPPPVRLSGRYILVIAALSIMLALALGYIGWHLLYHQHYGASYIGDVPPELAPYIDQGGN